MGFFKEYRRARNTRKHLMSPEESKDVQYFKEQSRKLIVRRNVQDILAKYYDQGECEMIPVKAPAWAIPIVKEVLDKNGIKYIVRESDSEVDIIYD